VLDFGGVLRRAQKLEPRASDNRGMADYPSTSDGLSSSRQRERERERESSHFSYHTSGKSFGIPVMVSIHDFSSRPTTVDNG